MFRRKVVTFDGETSDSSLNFVVHYEPCERILSMVAGHFRLRMAGAGKDLTGLISARSAVSTLKGTVATSVSLSNSPYSRYAKTLKSLNAVSS